MKKILPFYTRWFFATFTVLFSIQATWVRCQSVFQEQTPSILLDTGQFEVKIFNNLYTQTSFFNNSGQRDRTDSRSSYFHSIDQFLYGVGKRTNIGLETWISSVNISGRESSPFEVFDRTVGNSRTAISYLGPRLKFLPLKEQPEFSMEGSLLFPIAKNLEGNEETPYLAEERYSLILKTFYDLSLNDDLGIFFRFTPWFSLDQQFEMTESSFASPLSIFTSYFLNSRVTLYAQSEWWPTYGTDRIISSHFFQQGGGMKYMLIRDTLEIEILYTSFLFGRNSGSGQTFNIGFRLIQGNT